MSKYVEMSVDSTSQNVMQQYDAYSWAIYEMRVMGLMISVD